VKQIITFIVVIFSLPVFGTIVTGSNDCPIHFEGRVKEIIEPVGPQDFFSVNKVVFETQRSLKGNVNDQVLLDVLHNGPFKLEVDKEYLVQMRNGKLCWMEEI